MLPDSPLFRRALATAAAVLVVAGLVAVVVTSGGGDGDDESRLAGSGATSTTRPLGDGGVVGGGDGPDTAPETTDTAAPPPTEAPPDTVDDSGGTASPATTAAPEEPPDAGEAEDPGPTTPPRAGTYVYSFSRQGGDGSGSESGDSRTVVEDEGDADGERRQSVRQEDPDQGSFASTVAWRGDGVYVMSTTFGEAECDWEPDFRNLAMPLAGGATWSYETSCTVNFNGTPVKIVRAGEFEVVELTRIEVAGESVDVWKIESIVNTTFGSFGRSTEDTTAFFSPRHGLPVKSSSRVEGSGQGGQSGTFTDEREIKNLSPQ